MAISFLYIVANIIIVAVLSATGCQATGTTVKVELHRSDIVASVQTELRR